MEGKILRNGVALIYSVSENRLNYNYSGGAGSMREIRVMYEKREREREVSVHIFHIF